MDGVGTTLTVGVIGRREVQGLAVMEEGAASRQGDRVGPVTIHVACIQQHITPFVIDGMQMRSRQQVHGPIVDVDIIQREPATHQIGWQAAPVGVVLVRVNRPTVVRWFEQCLIMEELDIGADQVLGNVQHGLMVEHLSEGERSLTHLHDLQHLFFGTVIMPLRRATISGEIAVFLRSAGLFEEAVVFGTQFFQDTFFDQLANGDVAIPMEIADLLLRERAMRVLSGIQDS